MEAARGRLPVVPPPARWLQETAGLDAVQAVRVS